MKPTSPPPTPPTTISSRTPSALVQDLIGDLNGLLLAYAEERSHDRDTEPPKPFLDLTAWLIDKDVPPGVANALAMAIIGQSQHLISFSQSQPPPRDETH